MAVVAGVRFKKAGKVYYFDPTGVWPHPGDAVVVETVRGIELGETVTGAREIPDEKLTAPLKKIIRSATPEDISRGEECAAKEKEAFEVGLAKIAAHKLEMKLVEVEYTFDGSKLIFYFTANGRVDFRDLVKDLASVFKMRIELRQIGVRDEAKMLGGLGACGRELCCGAFLSDFQPVSIRMAKDQSLSLNPAKISGQCGRLMCCLKYEQDFYDVTLKKLPRVGKEIMTPDGVGIVTEIAVIREKVKVRMRQPDDTYDVKEYGLDQVCKVGETLPEAPLKEEEPLDTEEGLFETSAEVISDFTEEEVKPSRSAPQKPRFRERHGQNRDRQNSAKVVGEGHSDGEGGNGRTHLSNRAPRGERQSDDASSRRRGSRVYSKDQTQNAEIGAPSSFQRGMRVHVRDAGEEPQVEKDMSGSAANLIQHSNEPENEQHTDE